MELCWNCTAVSATSRSLRRASAAHRKPQAFCATALITTSRCFLISGDANCRLHPSRATAASTTWTSAFRPPRQYFSARLGKAPMEQHFCMKAALRRKVSAANWTASESFPAAAKTTSGSARRWGAAKAKALPVRCTAASTTRLSACTSAEAKRKKPPSVRTAKRTKLRSS
eukprot:scaffold8460_cov286-Pinguiococcus_pyrenoidosus.AAC.1